MSSSSKDTIHLRRSDDACSDLPVNRLRSLSIASVEDRTERSENDESGDKESGPEEVVPGKDSGVVKVELTDCSGDIGQDRIQLKRADDPASDIPVQQLPKVIEKHLEDVCGGNIVPVDETDEGHVRKIHVKRSDDACSDLPVNRLRSLSIASVEDRTERSENDESGDKESEPEEVVPAKDSGVVKVELTDCSGDIGQDRIQLKRADDPASDIPVQQLPKVIEKHLEDACGGNIVPVDETDEGHVRKIHVKRSDDACSDLPVNRLRSLSIASVEDRTERSENDESGDKESEPEEVVPGKDSGVVKVELTDCSGDIGQDRIQLKRADDPASDIPVQQLPKVIEKHLEDVCGGNIVPVDETDEGHVRKIHVKRSDDACSDLPVNRLRSLSIASVEDRTERSENDESGDKESEPEEVVPAKDSGVVKVELTDCSGDIGQDRIQLKRADDPASDIPVQQLPKVIEKHLEDACGGNIVPVDETDEGHVRKIHVKRSDDACSDLPVNRLRSLSIASVEDRTERSENDESGDKESEPEEVVPAKDSGVVKVELTDCSGDIGQDRIQLKRADDPASDIPVQQLPKVIEKHLEDACGGNIVPVDETDEGHVRKIHVKRSDDACSDLPVNRLRSLSIASVEDRTERSENDESGDKESEPEEVVPPKVGCDGDNVHVDDVSDEAGICISRSDAIGDYVFHGDLKG